MANKYMEKLTIDDVDQYIDRAKNFIISRKSISIPEKYVYFSGASVTVTKAGIYLLTGVVNVQPSSVTGSKSIGIAFGVGGSGIPSLITTTPYANDCVRACATAIANVSESMLPCLIDVEVYATETSATAGETELRVISLTDIFIP